MELARALPMPRHLCLLMLCLLPFAVENQAQNTQTSRTHRSTAVDPRVEMSLRDGWRFKLGPESLTELQVEPDTTWTTVSVPHTWNRVGYYKDAPESHINTAQNVVTTQGVGLVQARFHAAGERGRLGKFFAVRRRQPHRHRLVERNHTRHTPGRLFALSPKQHGST